MLMIFFFLGGGGGRAVKAIVSYCRFQEGSGLFESVTDLCHVHTELRSDRHFTLSNQN